MLNPYAKDGNWYKGNLHIHSTNSDGGKTPEEIIEIYKNLGYSFIAITDHSKVTKAKCSDRNFILLDGIETDYGGWFTDYGRYEAVSSHILCVGTELNIEDMSDYESVLSKVRKQGGIVIFAHPYWCGADAEDILAVKGLTGVEIFNNICNELNGKGNSAFVWDDILYKGIRLWGFGVDDAHISVNHPSYNGAWIWVKSEKLDRTSILESIKNGAFYSSQGPEIKKITVENGIIRVECSPVVKVNFVSGLSSGRVFNAEKGGVMTSSEIPLEDGRIKHSSYVRIECVDKYGKTAWSNPIFLK